MKKLVIIILISCLFVLGASDHKVIKFLRFGEITYDYYSTIEVKENYCIYYNSAVGAKPVQYIYGEFQILTYDEYLEDN